MADLDVILSSIGLSIVFLLCLVLLVFLIINLIQEAKSLKLGDMLIKNIKEKDKMID
jgi:hypothetical protein